MTSKSRRRRSLQGAVSGGSQSRQEFDGLGLGCQPKFLKTLTSSVTTAWGVDWDEVYIARDLMQNFFDANRGRVSEIRVDVNASDVVISAPTPFNLERLFYLGSEKDECDVGQYGEGFKVAATCLLRDHGVTPIAQCGTDLLLLRIADVAVQGTALYPVQYDFYQTAEAFEGTRLILRGSSKKLARACQDGLTHFFYEGNPLIGMNRWATGNALAIYDSKDGQGHLFYRNLKRGEIEGIPLVLAINKPSKTIENKIGRDRDRNAFGEPVLTLAYRQVAGALKWNREAQRVVVESARGVWERGHPLLAAIADKFHYNSHWPQELSAEVFGDRYYARSAPTTPTEQLEFSKIEQQWKEQGRKPLPSYFRNFGVIDARSHVEQLKKKADEESKRRGKRTPTEAEWIGIRALSRITRELAPEIMAVFDRGRTRYDISSSDVVLGQLRRDRQYGMRDVFLSTTLFTSDFAEALAVFLHEHAHIFGYDGSRGFTDALTELIESIIRHRDALNRHEESWEQARKAVVRERKMTGATDEFEELHEWVSSLSEDELRALVGEIPPLTLSKLRRKLGLEDAPSAFGS
ncbi:MAG TPA: hypothetical protein VKP69_25000 [Isosphaeraceae bacterium]|nr:hypothetical protein [Isosphaeraceae bacterium]